MSIHVIEKQAGTVVLDTMRNKKILSEAKYPVSQQSSMRFFALLRMTIPKIKTGHYWHRRTVRMVLPVMLAAAQFAGCIPDPVIPPSDRGSFITSGVIVINEGIWRQDNSTLTAYDPVARAVVQDYFSVKNSGLRLGDIGNSVTVLNGRGYIAVSTSRNIEVIELESGRSLGRLHLSEGNEPRQIAFAGDATGFVTTLMDSVFEFDPSSLQIRRGIYTGPAPEGIAVAAGRLFVANSGFGLYRQDEPRAGTVSVFRVSDLSEEMLIPAGPNPRGLLYLPLNDRLYVMYGLAESPGGLVEIDPVTLKETRRWPVMDPRGLTLDYHSGIAYLVGADGVSRINLLAATVAVDRLVRAEDRPGTIFHSIGVAPDGSVYVGALSGYTTPGKVLMFERDGNLRDSFPAGLNPKDYAFF